MKAILVNEDKSLRYDDVPDPIIKSDEVLVKIEAAALNRADLHSGEVGNQNFLRPPFWKPIIDHVGGTVVECNTAYEGGRDLFLPQHQQEKLYFLFSKNRQRLKALLPETKLCSFH